MNKYQHINTYNKKHNKKIKQKKTKYVNICFLDITWQPVYIYKHHNEAEEQ